MNNDRLSDQTLIHRLEGKIRELEQRIQNLTEIEAGIGTEKEHCDGENFRRLTENAQDLIYRYEFSPQRGFTYVSPAATPITGYTPEEHYADPELAFKLVHPEDRHLLEAMARGETASDQPLLLRWVRKDGETIWTEQRNTPIFNDAGELVALEGIARDVTEQVQAKEALIKNERFLQNVFDAIQDGISVLDTDLNVIQTNCWMEETYFQQMPLKDRKCYVVYQQRQSPCPWCPTLRAIESGEPHTEIVPFPSPDDPTGWIELSAFPLCDEQGDVIGVIEYLKDITERKRVERALWESEVKFRTLVDQAPEALFLHDLDGRIMDVNQATVERYGYTREQLLQMRAGAIDPDYVEREDGGAFWRELRKQNLMRFEACHRRRDGHIFPVEIHLSAIEFGGEERILALANDITERKRAEEQMWAAQTKLEILLNEAEQSRRALLSVIEDQKMAEEEIRKLNVELEARVRNRTAQLEAANQELEAFAYSVSHDLRAPLRAMDGFSAALLSHYGGQLDAQGQHYLERIQAASKRMDDLISDLLNLSRVTRREMSRQQVNLSGLAREIADELQAERPQRQVEFVIAADVHVQGDAHLLRVVLQNLIGNAWKFTGKRERARIEFGVLDASPTRPHPVYFVRDNGVGFDITYADKLFVPFQRLHGMREFPGAGIGLATVRRIIARHGGYIWTEAAVDEGAAFYFTLERNYEEKKHSAG